jgi:hypothetical protein
MIIVITHFYVFTSLNKDYLMIIVITHFYVFTSLNNDYLRDVNT